MDVAAIHQGFLRGLKARGGTVICDAPIMRLERIGRRMACGDVGRSRWYGRPSP